MNELIWPAVGTAAAALTSFGFLPQVLRMWRRRSVGDVSILTLGQFAAGVLLWTLYGFYLDDPIIIVANLITLATLVAALALYVRFRGR
jgi:MtN3 and saliva related transmembrane protein